jgi:hypothetical protein
MNGIEQDHGEPKHRHFYEKLPDTVLVRASMLKKERIPLIALAAATGLTAGQLAALLIGPDPEEKLRQLMGARHNLLLNRREELDLNNRKRG